MFLFFTPNDEWLVGLLTFLSKQIAESGERPAIGQTQALRVGRTPINGEAVVIGVVVGVVVKMDLQPSILTQFVVQVEFTDNIGGAISVGAVASYHAHVGLDGKPILKELGAQGHLVLIERIVITGVVTHT